MQDCFLFLNPKSSVHFYIELTQEPEKKLTHHNRAGSYYIKEKGLWILINLKMFDIRTEALACEKKFKAWKSPQRIKALIAKESIALRMRKGSISRISPSPTHYLR